MSSSGSGRSGLASNRSSGVMKSGSEIELILGRRCLCPNFLEYGVGEELLFERRGEGDDCLLGRCLFCGDRELLVPILARLQADQLAPLRFEVAVLWPEVL